MMSIGGMRSPLERLWRECRGQLTEDLNCRRAQENDKEAGEDEENQGQQHFHRQLGGHLRGLKILPYAQAIGMHPQRLSDAGAKPFGLDE